MDLNDIWIGTFSRVIVNMQLLSMTINWWRLEMPRWLEEALTVALHFVLTNDSIGWSVFTSFSIELGSSCDRYWWPTREGYKEASRKGIPLNCFPDRCDISSLLQGRVQPRNWLIGFSIFTRYVLYIHVYNYTNVSLVDCSDKFANLITDLDLDQRELNSILNDR